MFIDEVRIFVKAGDGGNGILAFRREKFVPKGGPSGGDGGRGGDVYMIASPHYNTLLHFRFNPEHKADRGRHGEGSNKKGRDADHIELPVPVGTVVYDDETGEVLHDFTVVGDRFRIARAGRGGRGNQHFATPTHQTPTEHEPGRPGEAKNLRLELKLLADAGLVGFPNAGKSTLISRISAARPKIADYPFTTLEPNLGVVSFEELANNGIGIESSRAMGGSRRRSLFASEERTFVVADIPGLIEGAHEGHGLGIRFLKHIERTKLLVHLVDVSEGSLRDPVEDFKIVLNEIKSFSEDLAKKPMIVVATKMDSAQDTDRVKRLQSAARRRKMPFVKISAVTGDGLPELLRRMADLIFVPVEPPPAVETETPVLD